MSLGGGGRGVRLASSVKAQKYTRGENDDEVQRLLKLRESNKLVDRHMLGKLETPTKV